MTRISKREEMVKQIISYFSIEITSDIYWKLFIFSKFSHYTQQASPKKIKSALKKEYEHILLDKNNFFNRFSKINEEKLQESLDKFLHNDKRIKNVTNSKNLIDVIPRSTFAGWIETLYPHPYTMGIVSKSWEYHTLNAMQNFFFGKTYDSFKISHPKTDLSYFYFSKANIKYCYFFNIVKCYDIAELDMNSRRDRRWDLTLYSALFDNEHTNALDVKYQSIASKNNQRIDFIDFYRDFIGTVENLRNGYDFCHSPYVVLCHIPHEEKRGEETQNISSSLFKPWDDGPPFLPFPIYKFESYNELLDKHNDYNNFPSQLDKLKKHYCKMTSQKYNHITFESREEFASLFCDICCHSS